jgi:hypothetical protein
MDAEDLSYDVDSRIDTTTLSKNLRRVKVKGVRERGERFSASLKLVNNMMILPRVLLSIGHLGRVMAFYETKAAILATLSQEREDDYQEQYRKELDELMESQFLPKQEKIMEQTEEGGKQAFLGLLNKDANVGKTYEAILYSGIVWTWCSFEVLTRELWEYALNAGGRYLGKTVIRKLPSKNGIRDKLRSKFISLDYLAQHDYDLSKSLGTALVNKFDFTSCNGISEAYSCAFPKSADIKNALKNKKISDLEATRNVIVHNAGFIDVAYCKRTAASVTDVGKRLKLSNRRASEYGNAAIDAGLAIMLSVSSNLLYAKATARKTAASSSSD